MRDRGVMLDPLIGARTLAAAANVVMQLSCPAVGRGVIESTVVTGQLFRHPVKRTRTTLTYLAVATAGTDDERRGLRDAIDVVHAHVRSGSSSPVAYDAVDPQLQLWVAACLYVGLRDTTAAFFGRLDDASADGLYARSRTLATTLQVPDELWPADRVAFQRYWEAGLDGLRMDDEVRAHLLDVVMLRFLPAPVGVPLAPLHRFITTGFLAHPFREELGLAWSPRRQWLFERVATAIGWVVRRLPAPVRRFPFNLVLWDARRRMRTGRPLV